MIGGAPDAAADFDPLRPRLVRIAYRMLGSVADAGMWCRKPSSGGWGPTVHRYANRRPFFAVR